MTLGELFPLMFRAIFLVIGLLGLVFVTCTHKDIIEFVRKICRRLR